MAKSRFMQKLDGIEFDVTGMYGKVVNAAPISGLLRKTRIIVSGVTATQEQVNEIESWPHVVAVNRVTKSTWIGNFDYVAIYLDCKLSEA